MDPRSEYHNPKTIIISSNNQSFSHELMTPYFKKTIKSQTTQKNSEIEDKINNLLEIRGVFLITNEDYYLKNNNKAFLNIDKAIAKKYNTPSTAISSPSKQPKCIQLKNNDLFMRRLAANIHTKLEA